MGQTRQWIVLIVVLVGGVFAMMGLDQLKASGIIPLSETGALILVIGLFTFSAVMLARRSIWHLIQGAIVIAVTLSNSYLHWTPNPYIPILAGVGIAFAITCAVAALTDWLVHAKHRSRPASLERRPASRIERS